MDDNIKHLNKVHEIELEIMDYIHKLCVENNIKYSLGYGSLIGAIRHNGFIPWDDDIDIIMPREDYNRFKKIWYENNHDGFFLQDIDVEEEFTQNFMKIRKENTVYLQYSEENLNYHKGIFVDIFAFDRIANKGYQRIYQYIFGAINLLLCRKHNSDTNNKIQLLIENCILKLPKKTKKKLRDYSFSVLQKYNSNKNLKYYENSTMSSLKYHFSNNVFDHLELYPFENKKYYVTHDYDEMLKILYGNYMEFPPKEERTWKHPPVEIKY